MRQIHLKEKGTNVTFNVTDDPHTILADFLTTALSDPNFMPFEVEDLLNENGMGLYLHETIAAYQVKDLEDVPEHLQIYLPKELEWGKTDDWWLIYREPKEGVSSDITNCLLLLKGMEMRSLFKEAYSLETSN